MMDRYYGGVRGLGDVVFSNHALKRAIELGLSAAKLRYVLSHGKDIPDGLWTIWREEGNIRLVILNKPGRDGIKLVKTVYRVKPTAVVVGG